MLLQFRLYWYNLEFGILIFLKGLNKLSDRCRHYLRAPKNADLKDQCIFPRLPSTLL